MTACEIFEFEYTHDLNTVESWDALTLMETWLASGKFDQENLKDESYKYAGIACSCDSSEVVRCVFLFSSCLIGRDVFDTVPVFIPLTA